MTYEEAFNLLVRRSCRCEDESKSECDKCSVAYDMIERIVLKEAKHRWHDLRKDPNDLPKEDSSVLIKFCNTYKVAKYVDDFGDGYVWRSDVEAYCSNAVTAWREIDPYEVTE